MGNTKSREGERKKNGCVSNRGCHKYEGRGKGGDDQDSRVCMTGMTRTRRMRKNQVEYKRAEGLGLYLEGNYYLLKLKANAKQGTSRLSISCHYRKN